MSILHKTTNVDVGKRGGVTAAKHQDKNRKDQEGPESFLDPVFLVVMMMMMMNNNGDPTCPKQVVWRFEAQLLAGAEKVWGMALTQTSYSNYL